MVNVRAAETLAVSLRDLFQGRDDRQASRIAASFVGCADIHVTTCSTDSRRVEAGGLFVAVRGSRDDGHRYVRDALERGAGAVMVERPMADLACKQCIVPDTRRAYARLCHRLAGDPAQRLSVVGVTGTNGKTTTTWLVRSILEAAGHRTGLLGTVEYSDGARSAASSLTTPAPDSLARWMAAMVAGGARHAVLEVSSHALDQSRLEGVRLDAAVVTNVTQDHFDYHGDYETYLRAKKRIFSDAVLKPEGTAIVNADDSGSVRCAEPDSGRVIRFSLGEAEAAQLRGRVIEQSLACQRFELAAAGRSVAIRTPLIGNHNVANCLAAAAVGLHYGIDLETIARGIERVAGVPGRLERINAPSRFVNHLPPAPLLGEGRGWPGHSEAVPRRLHDRSRPLRPHMLDRAPQPAVFVDYAHTPDALERCLASLAPLTPGRLICVFGAGGDRDRTKRPLMAQAVERYADVIVITSDNPRSEEPDRIIQDVRAGLEQPWVAHVEADRRKAIYWALTAACPDDCVVIAGKGHETYQEIHGVRHVLDDREVAAQWLAGHAEVRTPAVA